jgi:hypothetical protein
VNNIWISVVPGGMRDLIIGVPNPGTTTETITFNVTPPSGWVVIVNPPSMTLAPDEAQDATVHFEAPMGFSSQETIVVYGEFQDGTPGTMDYTFYVESTVPAEKTTWGKIKSLYEK